MLDHLAFSTRKKIRQLERKEVERLSSMRRTNGKREKKRRKTLHEPFIFTDDMVCKLKSGHYQHIKPKNTVRISYPERYLWSLSIEYSVRLLYDLPLVYSIV